MSVCFPKMLPVAAVLASCLFSLSFAHAQQSPLQVTHVPELVRSGNAAPVAALDDTRHLQLALSLPLRNEAALDALLQQIYDPQSPNFHHYLSSQEFTERFSPSQAEYDAVVQWAQSKGLQVTATTPNRHVIDVDGTVANIARAFNVGLNTYQDNATGRQFHAPDREPTSDSPVPLLAVSGLDNALPPHSHYSKGSATIQSSGSTQSTNPVANIVGSGPGNTYLPSDMRKAYYGSGPLTGAGQTVAIFSFDGYIANDLNVYYASTGMAASVPVHNVLVAGYNGACFGFNSNGSINPNTCDDGEQILDIVNVIGMAPGLTQVLFYESNSAQNALNQMATDNIAKVISSSWGGGDFSTASTPIFKQFQAQGQSYLNASGDSGQFNISTWFPPATDAEITQVGGTDLTTTGAGGPWASEVAWPNSGGGPYVGTAVPSYQLLPGVITSLNKGSTTLRNSPDVAAEANFDNTTVINGRFVGGFGGTSFAAPRWAGLIALANQQAIANGNTTLGFLNPLIYNIGLGSSYAADFHDITTGINRPTSGPGVGYNAVAGYDLVTGWGSPNGPALIATLAGTVSAPDYGLSASFSSLSVVQNASGNSTITVTQIGGFTGSVALVASGLPSGVTASFSPSSTTNTSTLTLTAATGATVGTATVTIMGVSGSLAHTATVALTVTSAPTPNYSLSASPSSLSVAQSAGGSSTIKVIPTGGFTGAVSLTASGLPAGVTASFSPASTTSTSTLTLTASSTATLGTATVTVTGTSGSLTHTATIALTITAAGGSPSQLLGNPGFESGLAAPWGISAGVLCSNSTCPGETAHAGNWFVRLDGRGTTHTDTVQQKVAVPAGKTSATLSFFLHIDTVETTTTAVHDTLTLYLTNSAGTILTTLARYTNLNAAAGYTQQSFNLTPYIGQTVNVKFVGSENASLATSFVLDDVTLNVQ
ncbi:MAG: S53 family peptidase [Acidobacteriaceae bacterium]